MPGTIESFRRLIDTSCSLGDLERYAARAEVERDPIVVEIDWYIAERNSKTACSRGKASEVTKGPEEEAAVA